MGGLVLIVVVGHTERGKDAGRPDAHVTKKRNVLEKETVSSPGDSKHFRGGTKGRRGPPDRDIGGSPLRRILATRRGRKSGKVVGAGR